MPKKYSAPTGVSHFYYGLLDEETNQIVELTTPERVKFAQTITVEMPQEATRAYGDNEVAEIATSSGNTTVTGAFHTIPEEDKAALLGQTVEEGITAISADDTPPYVAVVFCQTYEDGSRKWLGLTKGMFMRNSVNASTKTESTEFSPEEISGEFMSRDVDGKSRLAFKGMDEEGDTTNRDAIFQKVFGASFPEEGTEPEPA